MSKVSKVTIKNENPFPIDFTVVAQNKTYHANIEANAKHEGQLDWTDIEKKNGDYAITLKHQGGVFNYNTSYYTAGELANYLNFIVQGNQVVAEIND